MGNFNRPLIILFRLLIILFIYNKSVYPTGLITASSKQNSMWIIWKYQVAPNKVYHNITSTFCLDWTSESFHCWKNLKVLLTFSVTVVGSITGLFSGKWAADPGDAEIEPITVSNLHVCDLMNGDLIQFCNYSKFF